MQFGTNHLGHFALTGLLLDNMLPVEGSRVVTVSSVGHRILAQIHFDDLQWERKYNRVERLRAVQAGQPAVHLRTAAPAGRQGRPTIALAAHPGVSDTELMRTPARRHPAARRAPLAARRAGRRHGRAADAARRHRPAVRRAASTTDPTASANRAGHPKVVKSSAQSHDEDIQRRLWTVSEELTGVTFPRLMRTVDEHRRVVAGLITRRPPATLPLADALGLVLADDVVAPLSLPGFDNSAMDGYAVVADDVAAASREQPVLLPVAEDIPAGRTDALTLKPGTAHRIMTGAPLPTGATAVVPVEATDGGNRHRVDPRKRQTRPAHPPRR